MNKTVVIRGPLLTMSGYGTHSRQIFSWLKTKDVKIHSQILSWGITPWYVNADKLDGLVGEIMDTASEPQSRPDFSFQIQLPNEWDPNLAKYNVGITAAVETDKCNPEWIQHCNKMSLVVVPSKHIKKTLENSGNLKTRVEVIPEAFYDCLLESKNEKNLNLNLNTTFNFLIFGQLTGFDSDTDRKNTYNTVRWLCEEFKNEKDVGIVIKTNHGRNTISDREVCSKLFSNIVSQIRKGPYPKLYLLHGSLEPEEIQSVYQNPKIKAIVSATRGEGWGLPLLEAAATGLPVIATNWSGHLDFLNKGKFISLEYDLKPIANARIDNRIFMQGSKWAEVREKDFKKKLRKFYESSSTPKEWAEALSEKIKNSFSQKAVNENYNKCFSGLL